MEDRLNLIGIKPGLILEPGFIKPMASDTDQVADIENSELRKIANDVLDSVKYSFAAAAAHPEISVRAETLEATFQEAIKDMKEEKRASVRAKATELAGAPQAMRELEFGRYGKVASNTYLVSGVARIEEMSQLPKLEIDQKLLGLKAPVLTLPRGVGQMTEQGFLIPKDQLPAGISTPTDFEEATQEAVDTAVQSEVYDAEKLQEIWGANYSEDPFGASDSDDFEEQAITNKLGFYITRVKCIDETNPEKGLFRNYHDKIALAGISTDETGDTKKISEKFIGGGFDDGDQKTYSPDWKYEWFNMQEGKYWPKNYNVALILAEKDFGGLSKVLSKAYSQIQDQVKDKIEEYVKKGLQKYIGKVLAKFVGKMVAWVVDKWVDWIIKRFKDDIFPVKVLSCTVPSFSARWNYPNGKWGRPTSGIHTAHFYGHGGHYIVNYYWKLYA